MGDKQLEIVLALKSHCNPCNRPESLNFYRLWLVHLKYARGTLTPKRIGRVIVDPAYIHLEK